MKIDNPSERKGSTTRLKENGSHLYPVATGDSGEGLPYAPIDWPNRGDKWSWKVGKRIAQSGNYYIDRYLYLPIRLQESLRKRGGFQSKLSIKNFLEANFPGADVDAFFASFSWRIPAKKSSETTGSEEEVQFVTEPSEEITSDSQSGDVCCKAGNKMCSSLVELRNSSEAMACDVCCSEPGFCRDCCCILCCKTVNSSYGCYSFIKCEAVVHDNIICGHIAHVDCALRSYMAGTVGGSIGLDAEYYCRRCDMRTELVSHVTELLKTCESTDSQDAVEKILNVGSCILRGSQKTSAKSLLHRIELAMAKLKSGAHLKDIWKIEAVSVATSGGLFNHENGALEVPDHQEPVTSRAGSPQFLSGGFDQQTESLKIEEEIHQVLQALRKAQESEYKVAEERLFAQKDYLLNLYQQLDKERAELSRRRSLYEPALLETVLNRVDQIKQEIRKLKDMEEVANGFGKTSKYILREHFKLDIED